jgi:hypothetical protein
MLSSRSTALSLCLSALLGCGGGGAAPAQDKPAPSSGSEAPPAGGGVDIAALFAQEQEPQPVHELALPDGKLRARVEASAPPSLTLEPGGYYAIVAPNGPSAIQCFVYAERKDTAEVMRILADSTIAKNVPKHQWVEVHGDQVAG